MLTRAFTFTIDGVAPRPLCVEVDVRAGLPLTTFVGFGDVAAREAREAVRCALQNTGYLYPQQRVSVNLAPASLRGAVAGVRLVAAVGMLAASGQLDPLSLKDTAVYGHLALNGEITSLREASRPRAPARGTASVGCCCPRLTPPGPRRSPTTTSRSSRSLISGISCGCSPAVRPRRCCRPVSSMRGSFQS